MLPEQLAEIPDDKSVVCCPERDERYTLVPLILMILGLGCMVVGFAVPRDYVFDSSAPARQMEEIENFYIRLGYNLDICITVGMGLVALGSIMVSIMMLREAFCVNEFSEEDNYGDFLMTRYFSNYGAADSAFTDQTQSTRNAQ